MKIQTRDFGEVEIEEKDLLTFRQPIYGFENLKKYVLLYDTDISGNFVWLQSIEDVGVCFIMVDPDALSVDYQPELPKSVVELLGREDYLCWCIVTIPGNLERATVNLKSPVMVNPEQQAAAQLILDADYPIRQPLIPAGEGNT